MKQNNQQKSEMSTDQNNWDKQDCSCGRTAISGHQPHCPYFPKSEVEWEKEFDEKFYRNKDGFWISRDAESYGSIQPQMGRAELLRFIRQLLAQSRQQFAEEILEKIETIKIDPLREEREGVRGHICNLIKELIQAKLTK